MPMFAAAIMSDAPFFSFVKLLDELFLNNLGEMEHGICQSIVANMLTIKHFGEL